MSLQGGKSKQKKKRRKIVKGGLEIRHQRGRSMKMSFVWLFGFVFVFVFHPLKFVWGVPKWKIFTEKKHISSREKIGKASSPPLKNIPLMSLATVPHKLFHARIIKYANTNTSQIPSVLRGNPSSAISNRSYSIWFSINETQLNPRK